MNSPEKLTKNQAMVFETLSAARGPLSAYAILDRLRGEGLRAPLQIYRALDRLMELGVVHRLESINAFVACAHPHAHEEEALVAFAICEECGQVTEFAEDEVRRRLAEWAGANGFRATKTVIEMRGLCGRCGRA